MFDTPYVGGATSKSVYFRGETISTGLPYLLGAYNTATLAAQYIRNGASAVSITLATQTAAGAWSSGGFVHVGMGKYRLDVPNAALAAGADNVTFALSGIADVAWSHCKVEITGSDPRAAVTNDVNVTSMAANVVTASALATDAVTEIQSGLATAANLSTLTTNVATVDTVVDAIKVQTDQIVFTSGAVNANVTAMATNVLTASALNADAVTEITANLPTAATVTAIKAKTDTLTFSGTAVQADIKQINTTAITGTGVDPDGFGV